MDAVTRSVAPLSARSGVQSLDRAVAILNAFSRERPELGVSDVARRVGLTTSTTHRLLASLARHGLVRQVEDRRYALGPHVLRLAHMAGAQVDLRQEAEAVMAWLRDETGETVGLHLLQAGLQRVVVDQVESRHPLRRTYTELGTPIPLHQGAPGKVLLALLPRDARERVLSQPLEAATPQTITDPDRLREEATVIRQRGYALSFEERVAGIRTVAVPVWDHTGAVAGALSVTGPASRLAPERMEAIAPVAVEAGLELSRRLGFADDAWVHPAGASRRPDPLRAVGAHGRRPRQPDPGPPDPGGPDPDRRDPDRSDRWPKR